MEWKIVIVEDEDILRNGLIHAIAWENYGFTIAGEADNGRKGLELVKKIRPDVVFTDIRMAQMDGLTMAEEIHQWDPEIQLVFISGYDEFEYAMRALKVGAAEYILKPVQLGQVTAILEKLAERLDKRRIQKTEQNKLKRLEEYSLENIRKEFYRAVIHGAEPLKSELRSEGSAQANCLRQFTEHGAEPLKSELRSEGSAQANCLRQFTEHGAEKKKSKMDYEKILPEEELNGYYCAVIVTQKDFAALSINVDYIGIMELDHQFEKNMVTALAEESEYTLIRGNAGERILVLGREKKEKLQAEKESILQQLKEGGREDCFFDVACGPIIRGISGLYQSYRDARKRLEERYQEEWRQIIQAENEAPEMTHFINYHNAGLMDAVKSGSAEEIARECGKIEQDLCKRQVVSHIHLILIVTSIFEELIRLQKEAGQTIGEATGGPMEDYRKIISKGTRAEILRGLTDYCMELGSCFGETKESRVQSSLKRALHYVEQEFANENLTIGEVAKHSFISGSYLSMLLKKETGKTFIEYLTDVRMEHARRLLLETSLKNYEVAQACGFANATYFSTVFKSVHGVSPSSYRKERDNEI